MSSHHLINRGRLVLISQWSLMKSAELKVLSHRSSDRRKPPLRLLAELKDRLQGAGYQPSPDCKIPPTRGGAFTEC
jgi:hypothetical protein